MEDTAKLQAIQTFLKWKDPLEALDQIWYVVMEDRFKPDEA